MAAMFVAMVWHAHRRQSAIEEAKPVRRVRASAGRGAARLRLATPRTSSGRRSRSPAVTPSSSATRDRRTGREGRRRRPRRARTPLEALRAPADPDGGGRSGLPLHRRHRGRAARRRADAPMEPDGRAGVAGSGRGRGTISADRERLETALDALMENAVKATDEELHQRRVSGGGRRPRARGSRTRAGASAPRTSADLRTLLEDRAGPHRVEENGRTGLGLSIAKAIVDAHGGSIEVESEAVAGATFRITLPGFHRHGLTTRRTEVMNERLSFERVGQP